MQTYDGIVIRENLALPSFLAQMKNRVSHVALHSSTLAVIVVVLIRDTMKGSPTADCLGLHGTANINKHARGILRPWIVGFATENE